tara:strand:- start:2467 stop:2709 length:243 start_codon:yes stop_codon:yes gene_type:complete
MKTIKELKQEYKWLLKNGIDLSGYNVDDFIKKPSTLKRSFKDNPNAVKELHNYKFKIKRDIDNGILSLYERIEFLKFEKL